MSKLSVAALPEVFVSDGTISKAVHEAAERGDLRKLASRLYTRNLDEDPEKLVRRNWYTLIGVLSRNPRKFRSVPQPNPKAPVLLAGDGRGGAPEWFLQGLCR